MSFCFGEVDVQVVLQIVGVDVTGCETAAWSDMEVSYHLVDPEYALESTAFFALRVDPFGVVLALALLDVFASAEGPLFLRVGFSDFFAGVAAARFCGRVWRRSTAAFAAVVRLKVFGFVAVMARVLVVGGMYRLHERVENVTYRSRAWTSRTRLPSAGELMRTLFTPCTTPTCCSPETSITSRVKSSHGSRGKVMFKWISIRSPVSRRNCQRYSSHWRQFN